MYDRMIVQAEIDYRRERLTRSTPTRRSRVDPTRIPFVRDHMDRRAR